MSKRKLWAVFHPEEPKIGDTVTYAEVGEPIYLDEAGAHEDNVVCTLPPEYPSIFDETLAAGTYNLIGGELANIINQSNR